MIFPLKSGLAERQREGAANEPDADDAIVFTGDRLHERPVLRRAT